MCSPVYSVPIRVQQNSFQVTYHVPGHCSSVRIHIWVDSGSATTSDWLGWPGAAGMFAGLPLSRGPFTFGPLSGSDHTLHLQGEGQRGGCNSGGLSAWGGTLTLRGARATD